MEGTEVTGAMASDSSDCPITFPIAPEVFESPTTLSSECTNAASLPQNCNLTKERGSSKASSSNMTESGATRTTTTCGGSTATTSSMAMNINDNETSQQCWEGHPCLKPKTSSKSSALPSSKSRATPKPALENAFCAISKPISKPDFKPDFQPIAKPISKPASNADAKPAAKPAPREKPSAKPSPEPNLQPSSKPSPKPSPKPPPKLKSPPQTSKPISVTIKRVPPPKSTPSPPSRDHIFVVMTRHSAASPAGKTANRKKISSEPLMSTTSQSSAVSLSVSPSRLAAPRPTESWTQHFSAFGEINFTGQITPKSKLLASYFGYIDPLTLSRSGHGTYTDIHGNTFVGNFIEDAAHGMGVKTFVHGGRHEGFYENDLRHGMGKYTWPNGDVYVGEWNRGVMEGEGTLVCVSSAAVNVNLHSSPSSPSRRANASHPDNVPRAELPRLEEAENRGEMYRGTWKNGHLHGEGTKHCSNGDTYCGNWVKGRAHGWGRKHFFRTGDIHEGCYFRDQRCGHGKYVWNRTGDVYVGNWRGGRMEGVGVKIARRRGSGGREIQPWRGRETANREDRETTRLGTSASRRGNNDRESDNGEVNDPIEGRELMDDERYRQELQDIAQDTFDGNIYNGEWKNDKAHGHGVKQFRCGDVHVGQYLADRRHGFGIYKWNSGDVYEGQWKEGRMCGMGIKTMANGDSFDGMWLNDMAHGYGTKTFANGDTHSGWYERDLRMGRGVYRWTNGDEYEGGWEDGEQSGIGEYRHSNGDLFLGRWECGTKHGPGYYVTGGARRINTFGAAVENGGQEVTTQERIFFEVWCRGTRVHREEATDRRHELPSIELLCHPLRSDHTMVRPILSPLTPRDATVATRQPLSPIAPVSSVRLILDRNDLSNDFTMSPPVPRSNLADRWRWIWDGDDGREQELFSEEDSDEDSNEEGSTGFAMNQLQGLSAQSAEIVEQSAEPPNTRATTSLSFTIFNDAEAMSDNETNPMTEEVSHGEEEEERKLAPTVSSNNCTVSSISPLQNRLQQLSSDGNSSNQREEVSECPFKLVATLDNQKPASAPDHADEKSASVTSAASSKADETARPNEPTFTPLVGHNQRVILRRCSSKLMSQSNSTSLSSASRSFKCISSMSNSRHTTRPSGTMANGSFRARKRRVSRKRVIGGTLRKRMKRVDLWSGPRLEGKPSSCSAGGKDGKELIGDEEDEAEDEGDKIEDDKIEEGLSEQNGGNFDSDDSGRASEND